jgi:hypothetical protein
MRILSKGGEREALLVPGVELQVVGNSKQS